MANDKVTVALVLEGLREFISGTDKASTAVEGTGKSTETAGKKAKISAKSLLAWGAAAGVAYGAARFLKSAVSGTEELAKQTYGLQAATGLDATTASAWIGVLKERKFSGDQFRMSLTALSKQMRAAEGGSKTAIQGFHDLGISQKEVSSGNVESVLEHISNALSTMTSHSDKAALAQQFLGRAGSKLLPFLSGGAKKIHESLAIQEKYHNVLQGKTLKDTLTQIHQQRELNTAYEGVKLQLGLALIPVIIALSQVLLKIIDIFDPLLKNSKLLEGVIIAVTTAFVAYQVATLAAAIATTFFAAAAAPVALIAAGIVIGLVLLGIAIYEVIKHWGFFKRVLIDIWNWVKKNWPLLLAVLLGPFAVGVVLIIKHWDRIKHAGVVVAHAIKQAFMDLWNWLKGLPSKLGGVASSILHKIPGYGAASGAVGGAKSVAKSLIPGWQHGGIQPWSGPALVGEAGPELVHLPGGSQITPLSAGGGFQVVVPVYLDKRQIAKAVAQVTADAMARR